MLKKMAPKTNLTHPLTTSYVTHRNCQMHSFPQPHKTNAFCEIQSGSPPSRLSSETTSNLRQALCIISYLEASQIDLGTLSPDTRQFVIILANSIIRKREHLSV